MDRAKRPDARPFDLVEDKGRHLMIALRITSGGSVVATRPIRAQHDDTVPSVYDFSAALPAFASADLERPTTLWDWQTEVVGEVYELLDHPAVQEDRALQTALRRFIYAGPRSDPEDRLLDLTISAEALFIKRAGIRSITRHELLATGGERLLAGDPVLGAKPGDVEQFLHTIYKLRNEVVHGGDTPPPHDALGRRNDKRPRSGRRRPRQGRG